MKKKKLSTYLRALRLIIGIRRYRHTYATNKQTNKISYSECKKHYLISSISNHN